MRFQIKTAMWEDPELNSSQGHIKNNPKIGRATPLHQANNRESTSKWLGKAVTHNLAKIPTPQCGNPQSGGNLKPIASP